MKGSDILTCGRVISAVSVNLHLSALSKNVWSNLCDVFSLNKCKTHTIILLSLSAETHTHTNVFETYRRSSLCHSWAWIPWLLSSVCTQKLNKPKLNFPLLLSSRVKPKWSVLVSAVMNVPLPREAACTKARCITMVTCGTAQVVSFVPVTGDRSFAREPSVVVLNAHRWAWKWFSL